jgi:hypothetical protein
MEELVALQTRTKARRLPNRFVLVPLTASGTTGAWRSIMSIAVV